MIVQSVADARAAEHGGADRLEVVRDIDRDGLTPALDLVHAIQSATGLPLRVMVRENAGFELTSPQELKDLQRAAAAFADAGADGIVLGFARNGALDLDAIDAVLAAAPHVRATLHRAFDALADPVTAIAAARERPQIDRILTAGCTGDWSSRCERLRAYSQAAGPRIAILAGGGVDEAALRLLVRAACVSEVHVGRAAREGSLSHGPVSADRVRRLKTLCR